MFSIGLSRCSALTLISCKCFSSAFHTHDSVRVEKWDTVRIEVKGDTVRIFEKLHEREYFSTIYRDTLRMSDTLRIERTTVAATGNEKPIKRWRWFLFGAVLSFIVIFAA